MVWEPGEEAWEAKLAALRSYHRATGHLAPRQDAVRGESEATVPIGQHIANLRRKGAKNGLGKNPERAAQRAAQLTAIDPDWDSPWPLDWQRHYRVLADLVDADGTLPDIAPGVLMDGDNIGKWLQQPGTWVPVGGRPVRLTAARPTPGRAGPLAHCGEIRPPDLSGKHPVNFLPQQSDVRPADMHTFSASLKAGKSHVPSYCLGFGRLGAAGRHHRRSRSHERLSRQLGLRLPFHQLRLGQDTRRHNAEPL
ncbi:hypothetical protein GCM10010339_79950 [Streptomyces alanosinicus]|uniref:Helicase-associated domain-containing protein n=1 Tax=Streptomyces alanosinicus TaxID=68171 RepID=A0A919D7K6_9ACTN|nr:hypothetical protein GCM10010339_79950 [Streptomyces alanosinicus]